MWVGETEGGRGVVGKERGRSGREASEGAGHFIMAAWLVLRSCCMLVRLWGCG